MTWPQDVAIALGPFFWSFMRLANGFAPVLASILSVLALAACGGGKNDGGASGGDEAEQALNHFQVACGSGPGACHPSVAHVIARHGSRPFTCTGFLVAPDIALTAKHCLPSSARAVGASLAGQMRFRFPASDRWPAEAVDAREVIVASASDEVEGSAYVQDFAAVRLARSLSRPVLGLSARGAAAGQAIRIIVFDSSLKTLRATMRAIDCQAIHGSIVNPYARGDKSPFIASLDCPVAHGNSGAPILAADGAAIGLLTTLVKARDLINQKLQKLMERVPERNAYGTSFACARAPEIGLAPQLGEPACELPAGAPSEAEAAIDFYLKGSFEAAYDGELKARLAAFQARAGDFIRYQAKPRPMGFGAPMPASGEEFFVTYHFAPACLGTGWPRQAVAADLAWGGPGGVPALSHYVDVFYSMSREGRVVPVLRDREFSGVARVQTKLSKDGLAQALFFDTSDQAQALPALTSPWPGPPGGKPGIYDLPSCAAAAAP
jgi:hypothetical protein